MRIGADIGGTFTDVVLVDDDTGAFRLGKVLTTPERPDDAVIAGVAEVAGAEAGDVSHLVHGTTLVTRAVRAPLRSISALV
ncbi:MAG: hydantoinase/oxoprolinase N-terminal domain-containing protein, partial [Pseudomonadota bacterium]